MIDITAFCVKLEKVRFDRIRMVIYCAPGWGGELAQALKHFGARKKTPSCAVIRRPSNIHAAAAQLGMPEDVQLALVAYVAAWRGARRGVVVQEAAYQARRLAVSGIPGLIQPEETL